MRRKSKKLTPRLLRRMVMEERARMLETSDPIADGITDPAKVSAEEVDADDQAKTLEKDIDHLKVLKIHEKKTARRLKRIKEARRALRTRLFKKL